MSRRGFRRRLRRVAAVAAVPAVISALLLTNGSVQAGPAPRIEEFSTVPVRQASAAVVDSMRDVPLDIVSGPDRRLWFSMTFGNTIGRLDPATGRISTHSLGADHYPWYLTAGPDGNVWFADLGSTQIRRMSPSTFAPVGAGIDAPPDHTFTALGVGPDRRIWFAGVRKQNPYDAENPGPVVASEVGRVNPDGSTTVIPLPGPADPSSITTGPDGQVWFTATGIDRIGRVNPATRAVTWFPLPAGSKPRSIARGADNRVWFTMAGTDQVGRMAPDGTMSTIDLPAPTSKGLYELTLGPDGTMWFALGNTDQIGQITHDGSVNLLDVPGRSAPVAITTGPDGNLWFTQSYPGGEGLPPANQLGKVVLREASAPTAPKPAPAAPAPAATPAPAPGPAPAPQASPRATRPPLPKAPAPQATPRATRPPLPKEPGPTRQGPAYGEDYSRGSVGEDANAAEREALARYAERNGVGGGR